MVHNNDPCASIEVKSDFPKKSKDLKDFKVMYPTEHTKSFKLLVEPGQKKVAIIKNKVESC